jgi:hemolysin activation/secretion protein
VRFDKLSISNNRALLLAMTWLASAAVHNAVVQAFPLAPSNGVLPPTPQSTSPALTPPVPRLVIPGVNERPFGLTQGPKLLVKAFHLIGVHDMPQYGIRVAAAERILARALAKQPPRGYAINQLQAIAAEVANYYHSKGLVLAQAFVPAQTVVNGVVTVEVLPATLAGVRIIGNRGYSKRVLRRPLKTLLGQPINKDAIESALLTINGYPGVSAFGVLSAGRRLGTSDLTLRVQKVARANGNFSIDNEGVGVSGKYRAQIGVTLNDPFGLADKLQFSGMYEFDPQHHSEHGTYGGAAYTVPVLTANDFLDVSYYTNAYVIGGLSGSLQLLHATGHSSIAQLGYQHKFSPSRLGSSSVGVAFDVKRASFTADGTKLFQDNLSTVRLDYKWTRIDARFHGINQLLLAYVHGFNNLLGALGTYKPAANPNASRYGATGQFNKVALSIQRLQRLTSNISLLLHVQGQESTDPLVSLEQLSLAGPDAVRAYPVATELVDKGLIGTAELIVGAPGFANRPAFRGRTWGQELQFSLFVDYGAGWLNGFSTSVPEPTNTRYVNLGGWGGAVQFNVPGRIFARVDVATPVTARLPGTGSGPEYFFRMGISF